MKDNVLRVIVYGFVCCLIILTAYFRYIRPSHEERMVSQSPPSNGLPATGGPTGPLAAGPAAAPPLQNADVQEPSEIKNDRPGSENADSFEKTVENLRSENDDASAQSSGELRTQDRNSYKGAGISYFRSGDMTNAADFLEKAVKQDNRDILSRKLLAFAYYRMDNIEKASQHAVAALSLARDPELRALYDRLNRDKKAQTGYIHESSEHFKIIYDGYEHGSIDREIISILEDAYGYIGKELDHFPPETVTVILYTGRTFRDVTLAPTWSEGLYDGKIRLPVKDLGERRSLLKKILFHEYTHAVVHSLSGNCPLWLNEGLAEYFSTSYPKKIGQVIPLSRLEASFSGLSGSSVGAAYWESFSAVSFLIDRYGLFKVKDLLVSLSKGSNIETAFRDSFGITYSEFKQIF